MLAIVAGMRRRRAVGGIAGLLKATTGANEVISTIMLNWTRSRSASTCSALGGPLHSDDPARRRSRSPTTCSRRARLPVFWGDPELQGLHIGIFIALAAPLVFWVLLNRSVTGYEVRAVGFNPDAAEYGGISAGRNYVKVMAHLRRVRRPGGRARRARLAVPHRRPTTSRISQVGFYGIAVALLGRNTAIGTVVAALLFGALLNGTSVRNLDPTVFDPQLATNLTYIIQGLIVLFVSAPVLVTALSPAGARFRRRRADAQARGDGGRRMSTTSTAPAPGGGAGGGSRLRARLARVSRAAWIGWGGVALGVIAFYLALPPILRALDGPVARARRGRDRLGVVAIRAGRSASAGARSWPAWPGALGAYGAVKSGRDQPRARRRLVGAARRGMLRYATPLTFAALGGVTSERAGVVNIGLEGMMLTGAFFGAWGADVTSSWVGGIVIGLAAGGVLGLLHAVFSVTLRADQIVSGTAINFLALGITGFLFVKIYGEEGTPDDLPEIPDVHLPIGWIPFVGEALESSTC